MTSNLPQIIQGGMGVAISNWRLANAVSRAGGLGVISGTGIALVLVGRLMHGDSDGQVRRALRAFPVQSVVERILKEYYVPGGIPADQSYKRMTMWTLNPSRELFEITVVANFVEVWLAREGHNNPVGINLLEKVQLPNLASLYGAMLAGVDAVIMGAGVPLQIPGVLDALAQHRPVQYRVDVHGAGAEDEYYTHFDPDAVFPGLGAQLGALKRPAFLPVISSVVLAQALIKRATGSIQGFVIEGPTAGGHNAPPRGQVQYNDQGEPIYGERDAVDLTKIRALGYPFWLAGGYGTPEGLQKALDAGAAGIQVGTAFAYCAESGMSGHIKQRVLDKVHDGTLRVRTDPLASPTGFPFKVVQLEETLSDPAVYEARERICDIGFLRHLYKHDDGGVGYRCPAEPVDQYVKKGGSEEETEGRTCLCNNLGAAAGFPQRRNRTYVEPALITSGDALVELQPFLPADGSPYHAADVLRILTGEAVPQVG